MVQDTFIQLGIIVFVSFIIASIMKTLKQPLIISYILSGILLGPFALNLIHIPEELKIFSEIGIAILLFMVGLNINPKIIKDIGKAAFVTGIGQIVFTSFFGYILAIFLGFSVISSIYIALALTFSSTIIIMKMLSDKGDLETLYGRISVGFLIVQDIVVILIMLVISSLSLGTDVHTMIFGTLLRGCLIIGLVMILSDKILPKVAYFMAKSQELLFMFSIAWCFAIAALFYYFNFSIEIGALLAGMTLSLSPYRLEINAKMKSLRDFFISLFFIYLGSELILGDVSKFFLPILTFSIFILLGNPLIVLIIMGWLGYDKKTSFLSGLTVAQISEFSLILITLGVKYNHLGQEILSLVTVIGLVTIAGSTYFITFGENLYLLLSPYLGVFERKKKKDSSSVYKAYDIMMFGCHRTGRELLDNFQKLRKDCLVIDYDPTLISKLESEGINCMYGDAGNIEFLEELPFDKTAIVISTIPDPEVNLLIIGKCKSVSHRIIIIVVSHYTEDSLLLYETGATYVIMPYYIGVHHTSSIIMEYGTDGEKYLQEKIKHLNYLAKAKKKKI